MDSGSDALSALRITLSMARDNHRVWHRAARAETQHGTKKASKHGWRWKSRALRFHERCCAYRIAASCAASPPLHCHLRTVIFARAALHAAVARKRAKARRKRWSKQGRSRAGRGCAGASCCASAPSRIRL